MVLHNEPQEALLHHRNSAVSRGVRSIKNNSDSSSKDLLQKTQTQGKMAREAHS